MRELELRERRIQELRTTGERLLREEHPGAQTLEVPVGLGANGGGMREAERLQGLGNLGGCGESGLSDFGRTEGLGESEEHLSGLGRGSGRSGLWG